MSKKRYKQDDLEMQDATADDSSVEVLAAQEEQEPKVDFDAWFAMRAGRIPRQHYKEIIKADFLARGVSRHEKLATFDEALKKYGVKLD